MTQYRRSVLILLPPSEGKRVPETGPRVALRSLTWPSMNAARRQVLDALVDLCTSSPSRAATAIGVTGTQRVLIEQNARLRTAPTAPAIEVYSGVLYDALDFDSLPSAARKRADSRIAISSALWGLVRPGDPIPAYRFSADSRLPGLPPLTQVWSQVVGAAIGEEKGVIVDMRSGAYEKLAPLPQSCAGRAVVLRILQDRRGTLSVVSHHNKATKGRLTAGLLTLAKEPRSIENLISALRSLGYRVEEGRGGGKGATTLDIIVKDL